MLTKSHSTRVPAPKSSAAVAQKRTAIENKHRAQVYASNRILQKLEVKKFEQLQMDIAKGEVEFNNSWQSDCSSGNPSPTYRVQHHSETLRSSSAGERKPSKSKVSKDFELILKEDAGFSTKSQTQSRSRISSPDTQTSSSALHQRFGGV